MKNLLIPAVISVFLLAGCGEQPPKSSGKTVKPDYSSYKKTGMKKAAKKEEKKEEKKSAVKKAADSKKKKSGTVESVINYGTGATHLKIKRRKTQQLKNIQDQHNRRLQEAMDGN